MLSGSDMPLEPIACLWATPFIAYVGTTSFEVAYPELTGMMRALLQPRKFCGSLVIATGHLKGMVNVWERRGWYCYSHARELLGSTTCQGVRSAYCAAGIRDFGDRFCLSGAMTPVAEGRCAPALRHDILSDETLLWWRGGEVCEDTCHSGETRIIPGYRVVPRAAL